MRPRVREGLGSHQSVQNCDCRRTQQDFPAPTAPQQAMAPIRPRRPGIACFAMKTIDVVYSLPTEGP